MYKDFSNSPLKDWLGTSNFSSRTLSTTRPEGLLESETSENHIKEAISVKAKTYFLLRSIQFAGLWIPSHDDNDNNLSCTENAEEEVEAEVEIETRQRNQICSNHERWKSVCFPPPVASILTTGTSRRQKNSIFTISILSVL